MEIHGQQIHLVELKNKGVMKVPLEQFLAGTWVIFQPRSEPEIIEDLSVFMPSECYDFQAAVVAACIQQELATLTENHKEYPVAAIHAAQADEGPRDH